MTAAGPPYARTFTPPRRRARDTRFARGEAYPDTVSVLRQTLAAAREPVTLANGYVVECEWNIRGDIAAAQTACEKWPSELIFCSYEIGLPIVTCGEMQKNGPARHPVHLAYALWHEKCRPGRSGRRSTRSSTGI